MSLSDAAQVFLIGLWTEADDQGVFEWKPLTLRARLRPSRDGAVDPLLEEIESVGAIKAFDYEGKRFGVIRNFRKYQKPKTPNAIHPVPDDWETYTALPSPGSEKRGRKPRQFPINGEKNSLMEDGGGRMEEEDVERESPSLRSGVAGQGELITSDSNLPAPREISPRPSIGKKLAKEQKIPWPDDFDLNGDMHRYAEEAGIAFNAIHDLWERFKAHHIKNGNCWAGLRGWQMAWQGWVRNEIKFDKERREKNGGGRPARAGYDPIEYARQRIEQLNAIEEEGTLWSKPTN